MYCIIQLQYIMQYTVYSFNIVNLLNMYIWFILKKSIYFLGKIIQNTDQFMLQFLVLLSNKQLFWMRMSRFLKPPATEKHIIGWIQNGMLALLLFLHYFLYAICCCVICFKLKAIA